MLRGDLLCNGDLNTACVSVEEGMGHLLDPEDVDALFEVVKSAKAKWKDIGRKLGFTVKEMDNIVAKKGISQDQDYFQELLDLWLNWAPPEKSFPCTEDLLEALRHIGQHRLALKLEKCDDFMGKKELIKRKYLCLLTSPKPQYYDFALYMYTFLFTFNMDPWSVQFSMPH